MSREVFPREHLSTEIIVQHTMLLWSERSLGTAPTQVRDDPSSRLTELEEDEEIKAEPTHHKHNSDSLSQPVSYGYGLGENGPIYMIEGSNFVCICLYRHPTHQGHLVFSNIGQISPGQVITCDKNSSLLSPHIVQNCFGTCISETNNAAVVILNSLRTVGSLNASQSASTQQL